MKILILTDSLALPRNNPENCAFEDTWPILLRKNHREIHQVSIGAATSSILLKQVTYQKIFNPNVVILQVGIVDCAPRFMTNRELNFTDALGVLGKSIRYLFNQKWIRKIRNISYVKENDFKNNIIELQKKIECPIIAIGILPASVEYEKILPGVTKKIQLYNSILEQNFKYFVNSDEILDLNGIMTDHHHLNKRGHYFLSQRIEQLLQNIETLNV